MKENDILEVTIIDDNYMGNGIAKVNDITVFVPRTIKDEKVQIKITKIKKNIADAEVIKIINNSPLRQEVKCPYYDKCGGCNLLHISYDREKSLKENYIKRLFKEFNKKIISFERSNYRNKVILHVKNNKLGLYEEGTNTIVEIKKCLLLDNDINELIEYLQTINLSKIIEITIRKGYNGLLISIKGKIENNDLLNLIKNKNIKSIYENNKLIYGDTYIKDMLGDITYSNNNNSFFQINHDCTEKLYSDIKNSVNNCNTLLDLYCGTGSIGLYLHDKVENIIGIEINKDSVRCAKQNIKENNIKNYEIICNDASSIKNNCDIVVVDPPRSGLSKKIIDSLNNLSINKIVYISCNPNTLKRDIDLLINYELIDMNIYNMFPGTKHIESVVLLSKKS